MGPWPPPSQMMPRHPALTPILTLMPGMATTVMDTEVTTVATTDLMLMATTARDLPLSLAPTPRPTLTPGIPTMEDMAMELTDLMDMATTLTVLTVTLTGDKK